MTALQAQCQTADCQQKATNLLQAHKNGLELHLCDDCASRMHDGGWKQIKGDAALRGEMA